VDLLITNLLTLWLPLLAPPPAPAGCTVRSQLEHRSGRVLWSQELH
jgi:hypothetical protein